MEYVDNTDFRYLYPTFTDFDVRFYMFELLKVRFKSVNSSLFSQDSKSDLLISGYLTYWLHHDASGARLLPLHGYHAPRYQTA